MKRDTEYPSNVVFLYICICRQYFAVVYKEKPLEIWDLKNLCLLREMSPHFPLISALVSVFQTRLFKPLNLWFVSIGTHVYSDMDC